MTTHEVVPYLITMTVRDSPTDVRPIDDVDGAGTSLLEAISRAFSAARDQLLQDPDDLNCRLVITALHRGNGVVFMELALGRSGMKGWIMKQNGTKVNREVADTEFIPVRHLMYGPAGGHYVILLAERVGQAEAVTMSSRLLQRTFDKYLPGLELVVRLAMTEEVVRHAITEQPAEALDFRRPRPVDPEGLLIEVTDESVKVEARIKPRGRRRRFRDSPSGNVSQRPTQSLWGVLHPVVKPGASRAEALDSLIDVGRQVQLSLRMSDGIRRVVNVSPSKTITMSFPIVPEDQAIPGVSAHPTDAEFKFSCSAVLRLFEGQYSVRANSSEDCRWPEQQWKDNAHELWDVPWVVSTAAVDDQGRRR